MKLRVGDTVQVIAGSDKGKTGEIIQILRKEDRVIVEGVNMVTKHIKPSQADPEGGIVTREAPIHVSNVAYYDSKAKQAVKIGYAFDEDGKTARVLEFDIKRPIQQDGKMTTMSQSVKAPFIGLVPIPSLLIDRVDVDFQMEVTDTSNVKSTTNAEVETKASAKHWFINAEISGKVTTARENTRMTNQTAKYQIHVSASQQPQTEGLSKLMDIMASCIEPINTESSK